MMLKNKKLLVLFFIVTCVVGIIGMIMLISNSKIKQIYAINAQISSNNKSEYINITDDEAKTELEKDNSIILLDVRTKEEYDEKHIPNSLLIPLDELENKAISELKDKNTKIFVYCRSGNRSITASNILLDLGYTNVYNLGGIIDWKYETE